MGDKNFTDNRRGEEGSNANLILFPDYEKLKKEVAALRVEISMILLERDELKHIICKNIEMEYNLLLGPLEYKAYKAQCLALRLKRKLELIQACKNRQEEIDLSKIESVLDEEFSEYQEKLSKIMDSINDAIKKSNARLLTEDETKEIKALYRKIVKKLHPDLNPEITNSELELFQNAVIAYESGDLDTLRMISLIVEDFIVDEEQKDVISKLKEEKERLEDRIKKLQEDISRIKSEYPYTLKEIVENPKKTEEQKASIEDIINQYTELITLYEKRIEEMLR